MDQREDGGTESEIQNRGFISKVIIYRAIPLIGWRGQTRSNEDVVGNDCKSLSGEIAERRVIFCAYGTPQI
jgi:hypothetical protein